MFQKTQRIISNSQARFNGYLRLAESIFNYRVPICENLYYKSHKFFQVKTPTAILEQILDHDCKGFVFLFINCSDLSPRL